MSVIEQNIPEIKQEKKIIGHVRSMQTCPMCKKYFKEVIGISLFCKEHNTYPTTYFLHIHYKGRRNRICYDQNNKPLRNYKYALQVLQLINTDLDSFLQHFENIKNRKRKNGIGYVYIIQIEGFNFYKIGKSLNVTNRIKEHCQNLPFNLKIILQMEVRTYNQVEQMLLKEFPYQRIKGEWLKLSEEDILKCKEIIALYLVEK